jgi:hypothetical protein
MIQWYMVLITVDKSIHGNNVHFYWAVVTVPEEEGVKSLKDEFKINEDELTCEENNNCSLPKNNTPRLINMFIQI